MYGLDEISDDDDGLSEKPENMTPEQIRPDRAADRADAETATTTAPPPGTVHDAAARVAATSWGSRMAKTEPSADLPPIPPPQKSTCASST